MKGLTLMQPWASLVATGEKTIELRTWRTHHRGPLLIIAGARKDRSADLDALCCRFLDRPHSVALALVEVADVRPFESADASRALCTPTDGVVCFSWLLRCVRTFDPPYVPVVGFLGVRNIAPSVVRALRI